MTGIPDFYANRNVFITGATGFMGKVLLEKLLRSCPSIGNIYLLIRPRKGQDVQERLEGVLKAKLFDKLRTEQPDFREKIVPVQGDMLEEGLGLSEEDAEALCTNVSIVFHSAATVKFDDALKISMQMNVIGVQKILALCHKMTKLEALIHVSTAYANCDREHVSEAVYPPPLHPNKLLQAIDWMDEGVIDILTPRLVEPRPNTYTYTKAMAEYLLVEEAADLPVAIVRPSIVGSSWQEPMPGWVDNFNGPTGLLAAIGKGVLRCMIGNYHGTADIIPVDLATNLIIAAAWYTALERPKQMKVYNCTTGQINRLTWGQVERASYDYFMKHPVDNIIRIPNPRFTTSRVWHILNVWFDHYLPSYLIDCNRLLQGKKAVYIKGMSKLQKSVRTLDFFTNRQWTFSNDNVFMLQEQLSEEDRKQFNFDVKSVHWATYMENYVLGTKKYALKEELKNLALNRQRVQRLTRIHSLINWILLIVIWRLLVSRVQIFRSTWQFFLSLAVRILKKIPGVARS